MPDTSDDKSLPTNEPQAPRSVSVETAEANALPPRANEPGGEPHGQTSGGRNSASQ